MKKITMILAFTLLGLSVNAGQYKMPAWLKDHIHVLQPVYVARYLYNKQTAYVLAYPSTDDGSPVFDANGKRICILGTWDWNVAPGCPDFMELAKDEMVVWGEK